MERSQQKGEQEYTSLIHVISEHSDDDLIAQADEDYFTAKNKNLHEATFSAKKRTKTEREVLSGQMPDNARGSRPSTGVITQPLKDISVTELAMQQKNKCFTCGQVLLEVSADRKCSYSGKLYCAQCFGTAKATIPSKLLYDSDANVYPVALSSVSYLREMGKVPVIPLSHIPGDLQKGKTFQELKHILKKFKEMESSTKVYEALGRHQYLLHAWESDYEVFHETTKSECYGLMAIEDLKALLTDPKGALCELKALLRKAQTA